MRYKLIEHGKQVKPQEVTRNSFHLNGRTLGFRQQTLKLEPPCTA